MHGSRAKPRKRVRLGYMLRVSSSCGVSSVGNKTELTGDRSKKNKKGV